MLNFRVRDLDAMLADLPQDTGITETVSRALVHTGGR
jgi:hypothetical protein